MCASRAETEQTRLGVWKRGSEAWRPALLRSSHHSSLTCPVYSLGVNLELLCVSERACVCVCVCVCKHVWVHSWCLGGSWYWCKLQQEVSVYIDSVTYMQHLSVVACVCSWVSEYAKLQMWVWRAPRTYIAIEREGTFFGVCLCARGGCWRMYGLQLWWASRQAFPSPFPCSALLLLK